MTETEQLFQGLSFWGHLSADEAAAVLQNTTLRKYPRGSIVHGCGGECLGMIFVVKGELRTYILSEEGREITLFRLHPGEPCVLSASCVIDVITFETQMVAEEDTELLVLNSGLFSMLTEKNIYARCFLYELTTERFSEVMWALQQILFMGFDRRLAVFLYHEYSRTGSLEIKMTHEQIARNTGSAREVVSRMLRRFADDGLVAFKRGSIFIKKPDELKLLAE